MLRQCFVFFISSWMLVHGLPELSKFEFVPTPELIARHGYTSETHHVTTEDGYILGVYRIPYGRNGPTGERRPPVFLMHGLFAAANGFIALGSEESLAYNLADAGFDVWMGNARGNKDSRNHTTLDPDNELHSIKFWDFSWEDIGLYDISAMTDYIIEKTQFKKIHYIGHSQGGTVFYVLNSIRPEYNSKFLSAQLLAPAGFFQHFPNTALSAAALFTDTIFEAAKERNFLELGWNLLDLIRENHPDLPDADVWNTILTEIQGKSVRDISVVPSFFGGAAIKQLAHFGHCIRSRNFQRWDFGLRGNMEVYGTLRPPRYDMTRMTVPTILHYTLADSLIGVEDVLEMERVLPNAISRKVPDETFRHGSFISSRKTKVLVNEYIVDQLKASEYL